MRLPRELYDEMVSHARAQAPNECCGMIACSGAEAVKVYPTRNKYASPFRYQIDESDQYRVEMELWDTDLEVGAIYHSHTRSEPVPSQTDINLATYPDALYIIVGVASEQALVRAFAIRNGQVAESELVVL